MIKPKKPAKPTVATAKAETAASKVKSAALTFAQGQSAVDKLNFDIRAVLEAAIGKEALSKVTKWDELPEADGIRAAYHDGIEAGVVQVTPGRSYTLHTISEEGKPTVSVYRLTQKGETADETFTAAGVLTADTAEVNRVKKLDEALWLEVYASRSVTEPKGLPRSMREKMQNMLSTYLGRPFLDNRKEAGALKRAPIVRKAEYDQLLAKVQTAKEVLVKQKAAKKVADDAKYARVTKGLDALIAEIKS